MPFKKGEVSNPKGKKPGTKAKRTLQWEALAESITTEHAAEFNKLMRKLWASPTLATNLQAADLFIKTVEYFKPKQARVESIIEGELGLSKIIFEDAKPKGNK